MESACKPDDQAARFLAGDPMPVAGMAGASVRRLTLGDREALLLFRREIIASLPDADMLREEPDEHGFVTLLLARPNLVVGIIADSRIAAVSALLLPRVAEDLRAFHLHERIPLRAPPHRATYVAGTMVDPHYRGLGLQTFMTRIRFRIAESLGRTHHFATAALGNHFSWRNALHNGYGVIDLIDFEDPTYGQLTRLLLHRPPGPAQLSGAVVWRHARDPAAQRDLTRDGFVGHQWRVEGDRVEIGYSAPHAQPEV